MFNFLLIIFNSFNFFQNNYLIWYYNALSYFQINHTKEYHRVLNFLNNNDINLKTWSILNDYRFWRNSIPKRYKNFITWMDYLTNSVATSIVFYSKNNEKILNPNKIDKKTDAYIVYYDDCYDKKIKYIKSKYCNSEQCEFFYKDIEDIIWLYYYNFFNEDYNNIDKDFFKWFWENNLILKNNSLNNPIQQVFTITQESCDDYLKEQNN